MSAAIHEIDNLIQRAHDQMRGSWKGLECTMLIELVRSLDHIAFAFRLAPNRDELVRRDRARNYMLCGAAIALRPLLEVMADRAGGVPWGPTSDHLTKLADSYLHHCGCLAHLRRLVELEKYGLARTRFDGRKSLTIEVSTDTGEVVGRTSEAWLRTYLQSGDDADELLARKRQRRKRIDRYTRIDRGWFIRYAPDERSIAYHQKLAVVRAGGFAEAKAMPAEALLGGRPFRQWTEAAIAASGRVLHHIACATALRSRYPQLDLRNLLTVYCRRDDLAAVWEAAGEDPEWIPQLTKLMTLDAAEASACERDHEIPLPYYMDFGRDFVLLPSFGALLNPCSGLVRQLKKVYRADWDRSVDEREPVFRAELQQLFPTPRYYVPQKGFRLRRSNGQELTDVDAVILDRQAGSLALVQLKWHDIFGRSLRERNSRLLNLLKTNDWVERVANWISDRSSAEIASVLGIGTAATGRAPQILVIARHAAHFTGVDSLDKRATWLGWAELVHIVSSCADADLLSAICDCAQKGEQANDLLYESSETFQFRDLTVHVKVS